MTKTKIAVDYNLDKDADAVDEILKQIEAEKAKLAGCEGKVIASMFRIGLLLDLKQATTFCLTRQKTTQVIAAARFKYRT